MPLLSTELNWLLLTGAMILITLLGGMVVFFLRRVLSEIDSFKKAVTESLGKLGDAIVSTERQVSEQVGILSGDVKVMQNDIEHIKEQKNVLFQRSEVLMSRISSIETSGCSVHNRHADARQ